MATKKTKKMIVFGIVGSVLAWLFYRKGIHPSIATLQAATWKSTTADGTVGVYPGSGLNFSYNKDGSINIGNGYKGSYWFGTITTQTRNGQPDAVVKWVMN